MTRSAQPPKVSVIVLTYRQENYIDSALGSILGQEGPPVEIVVGDDASPDGTAARIRQIIADYRGPHSVRLLAHPRNLGLLGNFNRCVAACTGDIVVAAAGDDLSHPRRCLRTAELFVEHPDADLVVCNARQIDESGRVVGERMFPDRPRREVRNLAAKLADIYQGVPRLGAAYAYRRRLLTDFAPLLPGSHAEDNTVVFRALLRGGYFYTPEVLVDYRVHSASMSFGFMDKSADRQAELKRQARAFRRARGLRQQHRADLRRASDAGWLDADEARLLDRRIEFGFHERRLRLHARAARLRPRHFAGLYCALLRLAPGHSLVKLKSYLRTYLHARLKAAPGTLLPGCPPVRRPAPLPPAGAARP